MKKRKVKIAPKKALVIRMPNKAIAKAVHIPRTPAEMINAAITGKADLDKLEKLLIIHRDWEANEARKAYHKTMAEFKANLPQIIKDKKVSFTAGGGTVKYNHATLFNIMNKITPELSKHGLSVAWMHRQTEKEIFVTCRITHAFGYSEETTIGAPADNTGSKNAIQAIGSTISYLQRYSVLGLIGAATKDQDDDARAVGVVEYIGDKELHSLRDNFLSLDIPEKKFIEYMKIETLEKMLKTDYPKAQVAIEARRKQREGKK